MYRTPNGAASRCHKENCGVFPEWMQVISFDEDMNIDTQYEAKASSFLKKAVAGLICAAFPIASIVAIFLGAGNHKAIIDFVAAGRPQTPKIKTSAALSNWAIVVGIAMTIIYAICFFYFILLILAHGFSALPNQS